MPAAKGNRYNAAENRGKPALQRFAEKCVFDYSTGCVLWTGAKTSGRGNTAVYGSFWDGGKVYAHRWAAVHIHGIDLGSNEAGHCCPSGPNTLCVQHIEGQTKADNVAERNTRVAKANQPAETRQFFLFMQLGIHEPEPESTQSIDPSNVVPFHSPPAWLRPFIQPPEQSDDCPF